MDSNLFLPKETGKKKAKQGGPTRSPGGDVSVVIQRRKMGPLASLSQKHSLHRLIQTCPLLPRHLQQNI